LKVGGVRRVFQEVTEVLLSQQRCTPNSPLTLTIGSTLLLWKNTVCMTVLMHFAASAIHTISNTTHTIIH
jgi:hypothetical protein